MIQNVIFMRVKKKLIKHFGEKSFSVHRGVSGTHPSTLKQCFEAYKKIQRPKIKIKKCIPQKTPD